MLTERLNIRDPKTKVKIVRTLADNGEVVNELEMTIAEARNSRYINSDSGTVNVRFYLANPETFELANGVSLSSESVQGGIEKPYVTIIVDRFEDQPGVPVGPGEI